MREIKFREWDTERKTLVIGEREDYDDSVLFRFAHEEGGERILMQYMGLKDKNGVDIYEGDILEFDDIGEEGFEYLEAYDFKNRALVCFENGRFELGHFLSRNSAVLDEMNNAAHEEFIANITESLIIGNIYENPELLTMQEED